MAIDPRPNPWLVLLAAVMLIAFVIGYHTLSPWMFIR